MSFLYFSNVPVSFSYSSHLFTTIIIPFPASCASPAIFASWSVTPSFASIIIKHTSALSIASNVLIILNFSIDSDTLLFLLIPAVSISTYFPYSFSYSVSIASLVVPAILLTIVLFSPKILFINDDFPTFGFPITATFILPSSSSSSLFSGKFSYSASKTSPIPNAFAADTGYGSPIPKL